SAAGDPPGAAIRFRARRRRVLRRDLRPGEAARRARGLRRARRRVRAGRRVPFAVEAVERGGAALSFIAGDPALIARFSHLRSYGGCQVPLPIQAAATALWRDEAHVEENRAKYRRKFDIAEAAIGDRPGFYRPEGGFFLWLEVGDSEAATVRLWRDAAIRVLPGLYTARDGSSGANPGRNYI